MLVAFDFLSEGFFFRKAPLFLQALFIVRLERFYLFTPGKRAKCFTDQFIKLFDGYFLIAQLRPGSGGEDMQDARLVDPVAKPFVNKCLLMIGQYFRCIHYKKKLNLRIDLIDVLAAAAGAAAGAKTQFCM